MDGLGEGKMKSQPPKEETQAGGNLPKGSLFLLAAPGRIAVKRGHPVKFESQINNEHIFRVTMFQIMHGCPVKSGDLSPRTVRGLGGYSAEGKREIPRAGNHGQPPSAPALHLLSLSGSWVHPAGGSWRT